MIVRTISSYGLNNPIELMGSNPILLFTSRLARENTNRIKETKQERKLKLCQEKRVLIV